MITLWSITTKPERSNISTQEKHGVLDSRCNSLCFKRYSTSKPIDSPLALFRRSRVKSHGTQILATKRNIKPFRKYIKLFKRVIKHIPMHQQTQNHTINLKNHFSYLDHFYIFPTAILWLSLHSGGFIYELRHSKTSSVYAQALKIQDIIITPTFLFI